MPPSRVSAIIVTKASKELAQAIERDLVVKDKDLSKLLDNISASGVIRGTCP